MVAALQFMNRDLIIGVTTRHVQSPPDLPVPFDGVLSGYSSALLGRGALPWLVPIPDPDLDLQAVAARYVAHLHGLILTGGEDPDPTLYGAERVSGREVAPARDAWERAMYEAARAARVPILGVCRGAQLINVFTGGTLRFVDSHKCPPFDAPAHPVILLGPSRTREAVGQVRCFVNTAHSLCADRVGHGLKVTAVADDGVVEAFEAEGGHVIGVQWHPELLSAHLPGARICDLFLEVARERRS